MVLLSPRRFRTEALHSGRMMWMRSTRPCGVGETDGGRCRKGAPAVIDGLRPRKQVRNGPSGGASGIRTLGPYRIGSAGNAEQNRPDKWVHLHGGPRVRIHLPPPARWYGAGGEGDCTMSLANN